MYQLYISYTKDVKSFFKVFDQGFGSVFLVTCGGEGIMKKKANSDLGGEGLKFGIFTVTGSIKRNKIIFTWIDIWLKVSLFSAFFQLIAVDYGLLHILQKNEGT